jgi:DNA-binding NtrC family response regulator
MVDVDIMTYNFVILDKDFNTQKMLTKWLSTVYPDSNIHISTSISEAETVCKKNQFSICFFDYDLPESMGTSIIPKLKKDAKVIGISGRDLDSSTMKMFDNFCPKPIYFKRLKVLLDEYIF